MKIKPIVLAAGLSRRFHGNKLLEEIYQKPMFCHITDKLNKLSHRGVVSAPLVVTQYREIIGILKQKNIEFAFNGEAQKGISTSIKTGLINGGDADYYMFFTADQPYLKEETIEGFINAFRKSGAELGCVENGGIWGNPVIFKNLYKNELLDLEGDIGGKKILLKNKDKVFLFPVDALELYDIDSVVDLRDSR